MADIAKGFRSFLTGTTNVSSLVSTRIYPDMLPQNVTLPAATISLVGGESFAHIGGGAAIARNRVSLDCYADTRSAAHGLADAIHQAAHGYRGTMGTETVKACHLSDRHNLIDEPIDAGDVPRYRSIVDFEIFHTEVVTPVT